MAMLLVEPRLLLGQTFGSAGMVSHLAARRARAGHQCRTAASELGHDAGDALSALAERDSS